MKRVAIYAPEGLDFTDGQEQAASLAEYTLSAGGILVVNGYAGTGKSVMLAAFVEGLLDSGQRPDEDFVVACPTGRAAARLRELGVKCARTIHSWLYCPVLDRFGNLVGFRLRTIEDLPARFALLLDEASMISPAVLSDLYDLVTPTLGQRSIIAIGDGFQLPPVLSTAEKEKYGAESIFDEDLQAQLNARQCAMTEVVRQQADSPIIALATALRASSAPPPADWQKVTIIRGNRRKAEEWMGMPDVQVLTWTNRDRNELNEIARLQLHHGPTIPFVRGERLVVTHNHREANLCNGDLLDLIDLGPPQRWPGGTTYMAQVHAPLSTSVQLCALLLQTTERDPDGLSWPARAQKIKREMGILPVLVDYGYCLTCHKCVHPNTNVETPQGLLPIKSINPHSGEIATPTGTHAYSDFLENPVGPLLELITVDGYRLAVTPEHGVDVWTPAGFARTEAHSIVPGAVVRLKLGVTCDPAAAPRLFPPAAGDTRARKYRYPERVTKDFAEFLGLMTGDGTVWDTGFRLVKQHKDVVQRFSELCFGLFGAMPHAVRVKNAYGAEVCSVEIAAWLHQIGGLDPWSKAVPDCIRRSPSIYHAAFLRGLFEDGSVSLRGTILDHVEWSTIYPDLQQVVRTMLLRLGIISGATPKCPERVYLYGQNASRFGARIGFVSTFKQHRVEQAAGEETRYNIPLTDDEARGLRHVLPYSTWKNVVRRLRITRHAAESAIQAYSDTPAATLLRTKLEYHYSAVRSVIPTTGPSMCISVPSGHQFLQNGFSAWNSQGSEWPAVGVYAPDSLLKVVDDTEARRWLYTAITRAKDRLFFVGGGELAALLGG